MLAAAPVYAQQQPDNKQEAAPKSPDRAAKPADKPGKGPAERPTDKPAKAPKEAPARTESAPRHQDNQQAQQQQKADEKTQKNDEKAQQNQEKTQQKQAKNQQKGQQKQDQRQTVDRSHDQNRDQGRGEVANNGPRGNGGDRRIPEDRYRASFGRGHTFHVHRDHDRFDFGGFAFEFQDAWPSGWSDNDDFYIVEIDGVDYLCDARFPDQRIVVVVAS
jgi:hypothetical protein